MRSFFDVADWSQSSRITTIVLVNVVVAVFLFCSWVVPTEAVLRQIKFSLQPYSPESVEHCTSIKITPWEDLYDTALRKGNRHDLTLMSVTPSQSFSVLTIKVSGRYFALRHFVVSFLNMALGWKVDSLTVDKKSKRLLMTLVVKQ